MASWLSRATDAFRKPPPPLPEPFHIKCDCGGVVTGERAAAALRPSCPACGRPVFVLPISVYPAAVRPKKPAPGAAARGNVDESSSARERGSHEATAVAPSASSVSSMKTGAVSGRKQPATLDQPPRVQPPGILLETRTRILTPFRLVALAIVMIGILTGWGLWRRHRIESAKANVVAATEQGMKAFHDGDFATAARELTRARDAVELLQRTDPESVSIRRYAREAIAGAQLSTSGLFELLADYATQSPQPNPRFEAARRSWLLVDTVIANPDADGPSLLDMPVLIDDRQFRIEIDSEAVKTAARRAQSTGSPRVVFAAQPAEIRAPTDNQSDAVLVLNGKTAFLWTTFEAYRGLGYVENQEEELQLTRDLLARQLEQTEDSK